MIFKAVIYFVASILLTAVFSYSLQPFLKEEFVVFSLKTMLIPCFTWSVLIILSYKKLDIEKWKRFLVLSGWICVIGSAVLVPCGVYNFLANEPLVIISVVSVLLCVVIMSSLYYKLLPLKGLTRNWWWAFNVLIMVNMGLFYLSTQM